MPHTAEIMCLLHLKTWLCFWHHVHILLYNVNTLLSRNWCKLFRLLHQYWLYNLFHFLYASAYYTLTQHRYTRHMIVSSRILKTVDWYTIYICYQYHNQSLSKLHARTCICLCVWYTGANIVIGRMYSALYTLPVSKYGSFQVFVIKSTYKLRGDSIDIVFMAIVILITD
jgi:hypothetical protein